MQEIAQALAEASKKLFKVDIESELSRPDEQFGDYSTNLALKLAPKVSKQPLQIAQALLDELGSVKGLKSAGVAGPGFINLTLSDESLWQTMLAKPAKDLTGQEILVEFGDPNPFKEMHIGHIYSYTIGDSIASILEAGGAKVHRLSYHGDVGLHIAKAIWGMKELGCKPDDTLLSLWKNNDIGEYYSHGAKAYEEDEAAKTQINKINEHIYKKDDPEIDKFYEFGKQASFEYFDNVLKDLSIKPARRFYESKSAIEGQEIVKAHLGKVFEESEDAIVYKGEKAGLHTRVFINSKGQPTYEAKDLGLAELKKQAYPKATRSIIITAHEQSEYFRVMLAALAEFDPKTAAMTSHIYHGFVSLSSGKMSSRLGNVYRAQDLIISVQQEAKGRYPDSKIDTSLAAIKYGFLKHRLGSDIVYDIDESVSLEGNSGPYLQYAHARARSVLDKAKPPKTVKLDKLDKNERSLVRKLGEYPETVAKAIDELMPHHIATYLYELAQNFNRFYESSRIIDDKREALRLKLVEVYADTLKDGLGLLNIEAPERI